MPSEQQTIAQEMQTIRQTIFESQGGTINSTSIVYLPTVKVDFDWSLTWAAGIVQLTNSITGYGMLDSEFRVRYFHALKARIL